MKENDNLLWEIEFYEGIIAKLPFCVDVLKPLGDNYTHVGRVKEGLAIDLKLARLLPEDATVHYNLACSLSLKGNVDGAVFALRRATELGYNELDWMRSDPDLDNLRGDPRYVEIEQNLGTADGVSPEPSL